MLATLFCTHDNLYTDAGRLTAYVQAHARRSARAEALWTSQARRGMRQGALVGGCALSLCAHAVLLPVDWVTGEGATATARAWRLPTWPTGAPPHRLQARSWVPNGLVGPLAAWVAGTGTALAQVLGAMLGGAVGLVLVPWAGWRADLASPSAAARYVAQWGAHGAGYGGNLGGRAVRLAVALVCDALRLPATAVKTAAPCLGLVVGGCLGAAAGLRETWPQGLSEAAAQVEAFAARPGTAALMWTVVMALAQGDPGVPPEIL
jgi:hypothetical protein